MNWQPIDWQPIETAPKDREFLAAVPGPRGNGYLLIVGKVNDGGLLASIPGRWSYEPTHWMPLPEPPQ